MELPFKLWNKQRKKLNGFRECWLWNTICSARLKSWYFYLPNPLCQIAKSASSSIVHLVHIAKVVNCTLPSYKLHLTKSLVPPTTCGLSIYVQMARVLGWVPLHILMKGKSWSRSCTKLAFSCRACRAKGPCNMYRVVMYHIDLFLQGKGDPVTLTKRLSLFDSEPSICQDLPGRAQLWPQNSKRGSNHLLNPSMIMACALSSCRLF